MGVLVKLGDLPQLTEADLDAEFEAVDDEDDQDEELENDLCEARDLIEAFIALVEPLIRLPRGRKITQTQEAELVELCMEATAFTGQWEDA